MTRSALTASPPASNDAGRPCERTAIAAVRHTSNQGPVPLGPALFLCAGGTDGWLFYTSQSDRSPAIITRPGLGWAPENSSCVFVLFLCRFIRLCQPSDGLKGQDTKAQGAALGGVGKPNAALKGRHRMRRWILMPPFQGSICCMTRYPGLRPWAVRWRPFRPQKPIQEWNKRQRSNQFYYPEEIPDFREPRARLLPSRKAQRPGLSER